MLSTGEGGIREERLENYVVRGLVDFDDVSYDEQADLLYDLAGQVVSHLRSYLTEEEAGKVLQFHQRALCALIHAQMHEPGHYWERAEGGYEVKVSHGFTALRRSAYTADAGDPVHDYRDGARGQDQDRPDAVRRLRASACIGVQKFQSDTERRFAVILERDAIRWFKPAQGAVPDLLPRRLEPPQQYVPDFVAETETELLMVETKARNEMATPEVAAKRQAAEEWCVNASAHAATYGGKPWRTRWCPTTWWRRTWG